MNKKLIKIIIIILMVGSVSFGIYKIKNYLSWIDVKIRGEKAIAAANPACASVFAFPKSIGTPCILTEPANICTGSLPCEELDPVRCASYKSIISAGATAGGTVKEGMGVSILTALLETAKYKSGDPIMGCGLMATQIDTFADPGGCSGTGCAALNDSKYNIASEKIKLFVNYIIAGFKK